MVRSIIGIRTIVAAVAALALLFGLVTSAAAVSPPAHAGRNLAATLSGAAEVPGPADPDGSGRARVWVNYGHHRVCWSITVANITLPAIAAHIHVGAVGVAGPVVVSLSAPGANGKSSGCVSVTRSLAKNLIQHPSRYYVNVHTTDFPAGAVRGQLHKGH